MQLEIITLFCVCDEFLRAFGETDDVRSLMSTSEVMLVALVASTYFGGNYELSRRFLRDFGFIPKMLSKSRFNRRLHAIEEAVWEGLFSLLAHFHQQANEDNIYVVDSFPVAVCDNIRISRCQLYQTEAFRGRIASKKRYFYGLKVHLVITQTGQPVEFVLAPGSYSDIKVFQNMHLNLPEQASLLADAAYNDYELEDLMGEHNLFLIAARKKNTKRPHPGWVQFILQYLRKRVETTISSINKLVPKHIHAVTARGFELKIITTIIAFSILK